MMLSLGQFRVLMLLQSSRMVSFSLPTNVRSLNIKIMSVTSTFSINMDQKNMLCLKSQLANVTDETFF